MVGEVDRKVQHFNHPASQSTWDRVRTLENCFAIVTAPLRDGAALIHWLKGLSPPADTRSAADRPQATGPTLTFLCSSACGSSEGCDKT